MSISKEAQRAMGHVLGAMRPEPPDELTQEQATFWRAILQHQPPGWLEPIMKLVLIELCRHLSYSRYLAEALARLNEEDLAEEDRREIFRQLSRQADEERRLCADLSQLLSRDPAALLRCLSTVGLPVP